MFGLPSIQLCIGAGLLALLVTSGGLNACQHRTIGNLRAELGSARTQRDTALSANQSQSEALQRLEETNRTWATTCAISADMLVLASEAKQYRERVESLSGELAKVKANASPSCKALLETDFGAVCGPLTDVLRERATHR